MQSMDAAAKQERLILVAASRTASFDLLRSWLSVDYKCFKGDNATLKLFRVRTEQKRR